LSFANFFLLLLPPLVANLVGNFPLLEDKKNERICVSPFFTIAASVLIVVVHLYGPRSG